MSEAADRAPVIVGVGQATLRNQDWPELLGPADLMAEAAGAAERDSGAAVLRHVDSVSVINILSWNYGDAPGVLAGKLGLPDGERIYMPVGGNTPQLALDALAGRLARGEIDCALVAGGEAMNARRIARKAGARAEWERVDGSDPDSPMNPNHQVEMAHRMMLPIVTYPLFEPAIRVAAGRTPEEHRRWLGELMAPFTSVAAKNPYAWFREERTPAEIIEPSLENRYISTPYTKRMNAILDVDQGAAVIITTAGRAREMGVPPDRWVWLWGGAECNDIWYVTERVAYDHSPAMRIAYGNALDAAGVTLDDIARFDLYSCFPSAVQLGMEALGLRPGDPRPLTAAGGLPYAGGPGNNAVSHSVCAMVESLRERPGEIGLVTGNGWFVTKHSAGVYASRPPERPYERVDPAPLQAEIDGSAHPTLEVVPDGPGTIDAYSVSYSKANEPEMALALVRLDEERRTVAQSSDPGVVAAMLEGEWCGRKVDVRAGSGANDLNLT